MLNLSPGTLHITLSDPYWMRMVGVGFHYEIEVQRWLSKLSRNSWDFVDVGANIGFWSVWFGTRNPESKVVAVEPNPEMLGLVRMNLEQLHNDVTAIWAAVAPPWIRQATELRVNSAPGYHANASLAESGQTTHTDSTFNVPVLTLDSLLEAECKADRRVVIKLDIEGFETSVLQSLYKPDDESIVFLYEDHGRDRRSEPTSWLLENTNRKIYLLRPDRDPIPITSPSELLQWKLSSKVGYNLIALPVGGI